MDNLLDRIRTLGISASKSIEDNDIAEIICDLNAKEKPVQGSTESTFLFSLESKQFLLVFGMMTPIVIRIS